jgi:endonuclease YncB( thermonuclease family)
MRRFRPAALLVFLLFFLQAHAETLTGRVVRVIDGNAVVVLDAQKVQHKIRLQGIDAPERHQAYGTKSKEHLSELIAGRNVVVDYGKYDRYGRILGKVMVNGVDVNLEQVESGMAWHYKKYQGEQSPLDRIAYSDAEREARSLKIGLWRDSNPIPPWDYRQAEREQRKSLEPFVGKSTVRGAQ